MLRCTHIVCFLFRNKSIVWRKHRLVLGFHVAVILQNKCLIKCCTFFKALLLHEVSMCHSYQIRSHRLHTVLLWQKIKNCEYTIRFEGILVIPIFMRFLQFFRSYKKTNWTQKNVILWHWNKQRGTKIVEFLLCRYSVILSVGTSISVGYTASSSRQHSSIPQFAAP